METVINVSIRGIHESNAFVEAFVKLLSYFLYHDNC